MAKKAIMGKWIDDLVNNQGQQLRLETTDGMDRAGRLSGLSSRQFQMNGQPVEILTEIELNGDPNDRIPIDRIAILEFV